MAITFTLTTKGPKDESSGWEYDLIYDATSQADYKIKYGVRLGLDQPNVILHSPDYNETVPVRATDPDRILTFSMNVKGNNWDDILSKISRIKQLVDGSNSQALAYWTANHGDRVNVKVAMDGASYNSYIPIKYGLVDDSGVYSSASQLNAEAVNIIIVLVCSAYSERSQIILKNDLSGDPTGVVFNGAETLPSAWTAVGSPSTSRDTAYKLVGQHSCRVVTDSTTTEGIRAPISDGILAGAFTEAYIWIHYFSGADDLTVELTDGGSNSIATLTISASDPYANADKTMTGQNGETWGRFSVSGTSVTSANFYIRVYRDSTDASGSCIFMCQLAYLRESFNAPDAFASWRKLYNQKDTQTQTYYNNQLHLWGIPGDAPALVEQFIEMTQGDAVQLIVSKGHEVEGYPPDYDFPFIYSNSSDLSFTAVAGSWATVADANRLRGEYERHTGASGTQLTRVSWSPQTALAQEYHSRRTKRIFAIVRSSASGITFEMLETSRTPGKTATTTQANTWELIDLGIYYPIWTDDRYIDSSAVGQAGFTILIGTQTTGTVDVNAILMLPCEDEFLSTSLFNTITTSDDGIWIVPDRKEVFGSDYAPPADTIGTMWYAKPGPYLTIYNYQIRESQNEHLLIGRFNVTLYIIPRSRHLLGI